MSTQQQLAPVWGSAITQSARLRGVLHHLAVLLLMVPCIVGAEPVMHALAAAGMYALCVRSGRAFRREQAHLPGFIDDLAMFAMLFAVLLSGHGTGGGHHGGASAFAPGQGIAVVTALAWTIARLGIVTTRNATRGERCTLLLSAAMIGWMLTMLLTH